jgi:hypothetical protein
MQIPVGIAEDEGMRLADEGVRTSISFLCSFCSGMQSYYSPRQCPRRRSSREEASCPARSRICTLPAKTASTNLTCGSALADSCGSTNFVKSSRKSASTTARIRRMLPQCGGLRWSLSALPTKELYRAVSEEENLLEF